MNRFNQATYGSQRSFRLPFVMAALLLMANTVVAEVPPPAAYEPIVPLAPTSDPFDPAKVALGERLFNDTALSPDNNLACSSCHRLAQGGDDNRRLAITPSGDTELFNTPTLFNAALNPTLTWRGSLPTLEAQVDAELRQRNPGDRPWARILGYLQQDPDYRDRFDAIYPNGITRDNAIDALTTFERTLITPAPFDSWLGGNLNAISVEAHAGYLLFKQLGCIACHQGINVGGNLYQRIGIFADFFADHDPTSEQHLGRYSLTGRERDRHVFRVPSLRNVEVTGPYFHDGRTADLAAAVLKIGRYQLGRELSPDDVGKLVAFLRSLTGSYRGRSLSDHD